ncbi:MAG: hypothetical protein JOY72_08500 [Actinobacteria bacterium]|nr:hypothetical protein [Actinomycetota bacterium]
MTTRFVPCTETETEEAVGSSVSVHGDGVGGGALGGVTGGGVGAPEVSGGGGLLVVVVVSGVDDAVVVVSGVEEVVVVLGSGVVGVVVVGSVGVVPPLGSVGVVGGVVVGSAGGSDAGVELSSATDCTCSDDVCDGGGGVAGVVVVAGVEAGGVVGAGVAVCGSPSGTPISWVTTGAVAKGSFGAVAFFAIGTFVWRSVMTGMRTVRLVAGRVATVCMGVTGTTGAFGAACSFGTVNFAKFSAGSLSPGISDAGEGSRSAWIVGDA